MLGNRFQHPVIAGGFTRWIDTFLLTDRHRPATAAAVSTLREHDPSDEWVLDADRYRIIRL